MPKTELVTISEAARRAEVNRSTVQRWIARGELTKHPGGKVDAQEVERLRGRRDRPGRPCGVKEASAREGRSEIEGWAALFLTDGVRGLYRLDGVLRFVICHYAAAGRGEAAAAVMRETADFFAERQQEHGAGWPGKGWRNPANWPVKRQRHISPAERRERAKKHRAGMLWIAGELAAHRARTAGASGGMAGESGGEQ